MKINKEKLGYSAIISLILCLFGVIIFIFLDTWRYNNDYDSFKKYGENFSYNNSIKISLITYEQGLEFIDFVFSEFKNERCNSYFDNPSGIIPFSLIRESNTIKAANGTMDLPAITMHGRLFFYEKTILIPDNVGTYKKLIIEINSKYKEIKKIVSDREKPKYFDHTFENKVKIEGK